MGKWGVLGACILLLLGGWYVARPSGAEPGGADGQGGSGPSSEGGSEAGDGPVLPGKSHQKPTSQGPPPGLLVGPGALTEWTAVGPAEGWRDEAGVLVADAAGMIGREIELPLQAAIGFDLEWSDPLQLRILLVSDDGRVSHPDNTYDLAVNGRSVYLRKRWSDERSGGSRIIGQANFPSFGEKGQARLTIFLDRAAGRVGLTVVPAGGETPSSHVFVDEEAGVGQFGHWLQFNPQKGFPVSLSRLRADSWDGELPGGSSPGG